MTKEAYCYHFQWIQNKFSFHWNSVLDSRSPQFQTHAWATQIVATIVLIPSSDCNPFVWMRLFGLSLYFWDKKNQRTHSKTVAFILLAVLFNTYMQKNIKKNINLPFILYERKKIISYRCRDNHWLFPLSLQSFIFNRLAFVAFIISNA